jgi:hypothetical protein
MAGGGGDLGPTLGAVLGSLKSGLVNRNLMAMVTLHGRRTRFSSLLVHLVGGNLACGIEEGGYHLVGAPIEWWISVFSMCVAVLCQYTRIDSIVQRQQLQS